MSEKSDHITLTLNESSSSTSSTTLFGSRNKSLRRSWNQLPRCQRNLIILIVAAVCISFVFLLPSDLVTKSAVNLEGLPFSGHAAVRRNSLGEGHNDDNNAKVISSQGNSADLMHGSALENILPAPAPQKQEPQPQSDIENVVNIPQTQRETQQQQQQEQLHIKPIETAQLASILNNDLNNENNINSKHSNNADEDRTAIEAALQDPSSLPASNGVTIEEFLGRIDLKHLPQKQHFHGPNNERQEAVVNAFRHSWEGYKKYAWGHDNLKPMSQSSYDWFGLGLTIIDSLDTMYIMGLEDEFIEARNWVSENLNFDVNRDVNLFEVTIRILGGLLSAYHLSADKVFLKKSIELGNRLLPCFLSPSGIPYSDVNLAALSAHAPKWSPDSSTSEVTTIQLEFRDLSRLTNVSLYESVAHRVNEKVHALEKNNGLVPIFINANTGTFRNYATISLGARGDSYYEYLIKQWIQTGHKGNDFLVSDYIQAIDGVFSQLLKRTPKENHVYIGELINGKEFKPKMDHLTCYLPGTLLLGHHYGMPDAHLLLAKDLLETCYQTYMKQPTQLAPEISYFALTEAEELDIYVKPNDAHNLLRPEFVESLYYFYALTGNRTYQDMGWTIFQAFEKHAKVAHGYSSIGNVKNIFNTRLRDMMESFWLGETLKYFYLLFSNNPKEIDLEKWVFNTEAHPLPIRDN
ncbi:alpha-Mannosidase class I b isoform X2 [Musca autumnalis]|uniref:alpha-Mannosidase class I b isoform X2 n=1 Tax=Musca autumnalis TaxID=221902 RepID=UPI003CEB8EA4